MPAGPIFPVGYIEFTGEGWLLNKVHKQTKKKRERKKQKDRIKTIQSMAYLCFDDFQMELRQ